MCIWEPLPWQKLNHLQLAFLKHINFMGEPESGLHIEFKTGLEYLRELYGGLSMERIIDSANLMWELRQECERRGAVA
jgi:hypothetical protein